MRIHRCREKGGSDKFCKQVNKMCVFITISDNGNEREQNTPDRILFNFSIACLMLWQQCKQPKKWTKKQKKSFTNKIVNVYRLYNVYAMPYGTN